MELNKEQAFFKEEYDARIRRVQRSMAEKGLDALLVHEIGNICYLCGVQCLCYNKYFLLIVPVKGEPRLVIQSFEKLNAKLDTHLPDSCIIPYYSGELDGKAVRPAESPLEVSVRTVRELGLERAVIGMELGTPCPGISAAGMLRIQAALPDARFQDASGLVERVRAVKTPAELDCIRRAGVISSAAMQAVLDYAEVGMTDNDLAACAHEVLARGGSEYMCLDPIITIGPRSGVPHTTYARHKINSGDTGLLEFGACINRYTAPTMRAVSFGPPSRDVEFMAEGCIASINTVIEHAKAGAVCHEVALLAEQKLQKQLERYMWHGLYGYSVGLGFPPRWDDCGDIYIKVGDYTVLEAGMVFHVSTTLRDLGRHSITASETVIITETGCEVATSVPRKLFVK